MPLRLALEERSRYDAVVFLAGDPRLLTGAPSGDGDPGPVRHRPPSVYSFLREYREAVNPEARFVFAALGAREMRAPEQPGTSAFFPHANRVHSNCMHFFFFFQAAAGICRTPFASTWPASTPSSPPLSSSSATETFDLRGTTPKEATKSQIGSLYTYCLPADGLSKRRLSIQNEVHSMNEMGFNSR